MKKKKKKIEQWEKDWDKTFKSLLSKEIAVKGCGVSMNMNDYAKQFISGLIYKKTKDLFDRHNLLALSFDKIQRLKEIVKWIKEGYNKKRNYKEASMFLMDLILFDEMSKIYEK